MKLLQNKLVIIMGSFLLGGLSTYFISDYYRMKSELNTKKVATIQKKKGAYSITKFQGEKEQQ